MITEADIAAVGKTTRTHGVHGELACTFDTEFDLDRCTCFIFDMDAIFVPFFVAAHRHKNDTTTLVKIDDIDDEQAARALCGKTIYVKKELVADNDRLSLDYFIGFDIVDTQLGHIGTIGSVDDSTVNALFAVGEQLIPVNEAFIDHIDHEHKTLYMNLPEGLLSL
ncbi:MAG: ribosome maturation factor RimM [Bacteroidales bacterium]|nr:ribosome maturation factor RimM [Bacteroidales bacterium]